MDRESKDLIKGSLTLSEGVPYRFNELAAIIGKTRPTVERYIERFDLNVESIEYNGRTVSAVVLTAEDIEQIVKASQGVGDLDREPITSDLVNPSQRADDLLQRDHEPYTAILESKLEAALEKIEDLKALLLEQKAITLEQKAMYEERIADKDDHISTLKTSMVMMERLKRYGALDASPSKPGPLARLGQWLGGFRKQSQPVQSYQNIEPVEETEQEETTP